MRRQRVQRRPLKRAARRDLPEVVPAPRGRRTAQPEDTDRVLVLIDQVLSAQPRS